MLNNLNNKIQKPKRVLVFGSSGFIGKNLLSELKKSKINFIGINSTKIDLTKRNSITKVEKLVSNNDSLIFLSALTPDKGKDLKTFKKNIKMVENFLEGIKNKKLNHLIYFSSDAVYSFENTLISEKTPLFSGDYYSLMHITRELMIKNEVNCPSLFIRPTAVFGFGDTHNSYGPNRFLKDAISKKNITLGGKGEETRDHIFINDLINLSVLCILYKTIGFLNAATGFSISFMDLAKLIKKKIPEIQINTTERNNSITYRKFNIDQLNTIFNDFSFTKIEDSLSQYLKKVNKK